MTTDIQPTPKKKFHLIDEILPNGIHRTAITKEAQRVFVGIWNKLNGYGSDSIWIRNEHLILMSRVRPDKLDSALSELSGAGLLEIKIGLVQNRYRVTAPDQDEAAA